MASPPSQDRKDQDTANQQQAQYAKSQPVPVFNWSFERHNTIELLKIRNERAVTHAVWRSDYGTIEGDCPSIGFGLPYDTSLTNPLKPYGRVGTALTSIEQAEPNGIFISKNTSATWVLCVGDNGQIDPHYIESKVTVYPYSVNVDYVKNRVTRAGKSTVSFK
ncbi:hypothetical protein [Vibrio phage vB_VhaP_PG11]|nr:hypothetical protein [Vibrio phage vB_VhaP_PG11]